MKPSLVEALRHWRTAVIQGGLQKSLCRQQAAATVLSRATSPHLVMHEIPYGTPHATHPSVAHQRLRSDLISIVAIGVPPAPPTGYAFAGCAALLAKQEPGRVGMGSQCRRMTPKGS